MTVARGIADGEYYHVFNRGAHRRGIFRDKTDPLRLLFHVLHCQSPFRFRNVARTVARYSPVDGYPLPEAELSAIEQNRVVEVVCFALMPNHFHLLLKELVPGGIALYTQRVFEGYTKYFNTKYEGSGHLFQGRYKAVHVRDNRQLLYLSAYIHRNPREIKEWATKEDEYPWSSLQDYVTANRWGGLLATDIIADQFAATSRSNYADFVKTSTAKVLKEELEGLNLV